jgi:hypothetical protein
LIFFPLHPILHLQSRLFFQLICYRHYLPQHRLSHSDILPRTVPALVRPQYIAQRINQAAHYAHHQESLPSHRGGCAPRRASARPSRCLCPSLNRHQGAYRVQAEWLACACTLVSLATVLLTCTVEINDSGVYLPVRTSSSYYSNTLLTHPTSLPRPSARTSGRPNRAARPTQPPATVLCSATSLSTFLENPSTHTGDHSYVTSLKIPTCPEPNTTATGYLSSLAHHPTRGPSPPISRFFIPPPTPTQLSRSQQTSTNSRRRFRRRRS